MLNAIDLRTLRNGEFVQFGADFHGLINANNPVALNIEPQLLIFKSSLDETTRLFKLERTSPVTQELVLLDERRDKAIIGLAGAIDSYCYHFDAATANAASVLADNLKLYGTGIAKLNFPTESASITAIINDWETKPKLAAAVTKLGLAAWVAELKAANQLFGQKYLERTQEFGAANPDTLKAKREETLAAYYELRKFIDAYAVINPSAAYDKLIKELNALIDQYNGLLSSRLAETAMEPATAKN
jgi:hypothetical protein